MILITTPTGHIGSQLLGQLLKSKEKLRVLVRDPGKLPAEARGRVDVIQGSLENLEDLNRAYHNVDDLFFVIPPSVSYENAVDYYLHFGRLTLKAAVANNVKRIIFISGTGLDPDGDAGAVSASVHVEKLLEKSGISVRVIHCGTFMENLFHSAGQIKANQQFGTSCPGDAKVPWVATKDIAAISEKSLLDKSWSGVGSVGVLGPQDLSYNEIAKIMSDVSGKKISYRPISAEVLKANMVKFGASEAGAQSLVDIYRSMEAKTFNLVTRTSENTTPTDFRSWLTDHAEIFGFN